MTVIVTALVLMAIAAGVTWGLLDQALEMRRMRAEVESARRIIALLIETRQCERDDDRQVREWLA